MEALRDRLEGFLAQVLFPALNQHQQRHWGGAFVRGFLLDGDRKSAGASADRLPDGNEQAMQQFLTNSVWDFREVRRRLAQQMEPLLPVEPAVWVHDDTGSPKKARGETPRPAEWLIMEWPQGEEEPTDFRLSNLSEETSLRALVRLGKMRWHIEPDYQQLKEALGLDHSEGRKWIGWHRHVTLTTLAFAFLLLERIRGQKGGFR